MSSGIQTKSLVPDWVSSVMDEFVYRGLISGRMSMDDGSSGLLRAGRAHQLFEILQGIDTGAINTDHLMLEDLRSIGRLILEFKDDFIMIFPDQQKLLLRMSRYLTVSIRDYRVKLENIAGVKLIPVQRDNVVSSAEFSQDLSRDTKRPNGDISSREQKQKSYAPRQHIQAEPEQPDKTDQVLISEQPDDTDRVSVAEQPDDTDRVSVAEQPDDTDRVFIAKRTTSEYHRHLKNFIQFYYDRNLSRASVEMREARLRAPDNPAVLFWSARLNILTGARDRAIRDLGKVLHICGQNVTVQAWGARDHDIVILEAEELVNKRPENVTARYWLATLHFQAGNRNRAREEIKIALDLISGPP